MSDNQPAIATPTIASTDGTQPGAAIEDLSGQLISGRYLVEQCLGTGAMGAVYRAKHTLMEKAVAVKVLRPQIGQRDDLVERFRREAQAAANIDHPNICSASDFGRMDDGAFFLVMEYLEGQTLEEFIEGQAPLAAERAVDIAAQICAALDRAHELDIVHRDLKPENIMLLPRDDGGDLVKILDFGVAKVRLTDEHEQAQLTKAGTVWGTPCYMSPEQAAGGDVDGRSDLYSVGVILFEMLAGRPPFVDDNPARVMALHLTAEPPALSDVADTADIPAHLEALVMRLLAKNPADRPATADRLRQYLLGEADLEPARPSRQSGGQVLRLGADALVHAYTWSETQWARALQWFRAQTTLLQGVILGVAAATMLAMAIVPIVITAAIAGPTSNAERKEIAKDLGDERAQFLKTAGLSDVPVALKENRTSDALDALSHVDQKYADNPHVAYLRGRVNGARRRWQAAMDAYEQALEAESDYANDTALVDDVFARFSERSDARAAQARHIIATYLDNDYATHKLAELAKYGDSSPVRDRALDVLEKTRRLGDLEDWNRLSVQLRHAGDCDRRKSLIDALVDEGDPHGAEILEYMADRGQTGCGFLHLQDCYACIRGDLGPAIKKLQDDGG